MTVEDAASKPFPNMYEDNFGGVTIEIHDDEPLMGANDFHVRLAAHLNIFSQQEKAGIWLMLPLAVSHYVPAAVDLGFTYHHAKPEYCMLTRWLPEDRPSTLPKPPHTLVGAAGMVINHHGEVLVMQEKFGRPGFWKLPGGLKDQGEDLAAAAVREVLEETGIDVEFRCVAAFREHHGGAYGATDFYTICCCVLPEGAEQRPTPQPQEAEVAACEWMDVDEFLSAEWYSNGSLLGVHLHTAAEVCRQVLAGESSGLNLSQLPAGYSQNGEPAPTHNLYHAGEPLAPRL